MDNHDCIGSSFDDFLKEEGLYDECKNAAIEKVENWLKEQKQDGVTHGE